MHSARIPVVHNFGIVSKKIADTLLEEFEEKEEVYKIPSPSPDMPSSPRLKTTPTSALTHLTPRGRQFEFISSSFIQDYNKCSEEIETSPTNNRLHRKLENTLQLTERRLSLTTSTDTGDHWKDLLFMYQCKGPLQTRALAALSNSLTSHSLLKSPHHLFSVLHIVPLELRDLIGPQEDGTTSSPNNFKQSNNLLKSIYPSQILQTGYNRLYLHFLLGRLNCFSNFSLVLTVLQSSLTNELLALSESFPFVWLCLRHATSVLTHISDNTDTDSDHDKAKDVPRVFNRENSTHDSTATPDSAGLSDQLSTELSHTLDIWYQVAFCHSQNLQACILQFVRCYISHQQSQNIIQFALMLDILTLLSLTNTEIAEILILLPILNAYSSHTNRIFQTEQDTPQNWSSVSQMVSELSDFYSKHYDRTFQWDAEHSCHYILSITRVALQTKISYIRRLCLTGNVLSNRIDYRIGLGLIELTSYQDDSNIDFSTKIRYLALKGTKDLLATHNSQVSTEKQSLAPLGIREIALQTCKNCLENESSQPVNFLLNHYRPCASVLLTSSREFLHSTLMLVHSSCMKVSDSITNPSKSLTSSVSNMSKSSTKQTFHIFPRTPSRETRHKIQTDIIRNNPHTNTSCVRNELKMRGISYQTWQKKCDQQTAD